MRDGFIKVAAVSPKIRVADAAYNSKVICEGIREAAREGAKVIVFPELSITGYTCGDLFLQETLLAGALEALREIMTFTEGQDAIVFVGFPFAYNGKIYNAAAALKGGRLLGIIPKTYLPAYGEFYETRYFARGMEETLTVSCLGQETLFGTKLLFACEELRELVIGAEICEDLWTPEPPGIRHARNGATVLVNLSASNETTGKEDYRRALVCGQSARLLCGYIYASAGEGESTQDVVYSGLSASNETTGKEDYRRALVCGQSARLLCGYIYASAGEGESTQDVVYSGHNMIAENGRLLKEAPRFVNEITLSEIDVQRLAAERRRITTFEPREDGYRRVAFSLIVEETALRFVNEITLSEIDVQRLAAERRRITTFEPREDGYRRVAFSLIVEETALTRAIKALPFVPSDEADRQRRCAQILAIQAAGLKKRMEHTNCKTAVVGISGGLDSALALLVVVRAFDLLGLAHEGIKAVTMPGFGTTDRTYENAVQLIRSLGADFREIDIKEAVQLHFRDIGHDVSAHDGFGTTDRTYENAVQLIRSLGADFREIDIKEAVQLHFRDIGHDVSAHDVTYENSQARERTQILMDVANKENGMVIGTGDLSELAIGWETYNGDHMSMYGVNASVPKTLVRHLVRFYADTCGDETLRRVLYDVLDTPVSPELLPPEDGRISQETENIVGPYELHDFYLYHMLREGCPPKKIYRLAGGRKDLAGNRKYCRTLRAA